MLTSSEALLEALSQLAGVDVAVIGETTEALLIAGTGPDEPLRRLVRHQVHIFQQQAELLEDMGMEQGLVETLITLHDHYHIARFMVAEGMEGFFLYVVLSRQKTNLGMARVKLAELAQRTQLSPQERERLVHAARADEAGYYPIGDSPQEVAPPEPKPKTSEGRLRRLLHLSLRPT